jgi:hypothetical protein
MRNSFLKLLLLKVLFFISGSLVAQETIEYAPVLVEGTWKCIDRNGNFILSEYPSQADYISFEDKLALSIKDKKYGYVDLQNKLVIPYQFDQALKFEKGFAAVAVGKKWGIVNAQGQYIVKPEYDLAGNFGKEMLAPILKDNKVAFVDTKGEIKIPFKYYWRKNLGAALDYPVFSDGLLAVLVPNDSNKTSEYKLGFMNVRGELQVEAKYIKASGFNEGISSVIRDGKIFLIDTNGVELIELQGIGYQPLKFIKGFSEIKSDDGTYGFINKNGKIILLPIYDGVEQFSEGYAAVTFNEKSISAKSVYIDTTGAFAFNGRRFGFVNSFKEGKAAVQVDGKWGFINTTGMDIMEPVFQNATNFSNGIAVVSIMKGKKVKYGFVDPAGKFIIKPKFADAANFANGLAPVKIGKLWGFIDQKGKVVIKPKFENAKGFEKVKVGK